MFKKLLYNTIMMFDSLYVYLYPKDKSDQIKLLLNDYSETEVYLSNFVEARGQETLKEIYVIINNFYIWKLNSLIVEGNDIEISKLKYLQVLLLDMKDTLNTNSDNNG